MCVYMCVFSVCSFGRVDWPTVYYCITVVARLSVKWGYFLCTVCNVCFSYNCSTVCNDGQSLLPKPIRVTLHLSAGFFVFFASSAIAIFVSVFQ